MRKCYCKSGKKKQEFYLQNLVTEVVKLIKIILSVLVLS